jgi:hypothetical protein
MVKQIINKYQNLDLFDRILLICFSVIYIVLIPCLFYVALRGDHFVQWAYEQQVPILRQLFQTQYPLDHYLALKEDIAFNLFFLSVLFSVFTISGLVFLNRLFFSDKKLSPFWVISICCLLTSFVYIYNYELRITSIHTFFRAGPAYQIINGHCPPQDPLFGGEPLHYQWGYVWAAAMVSKLLNVTPFTSFGIINVLSLAGCLWLLYKISNLLIDNPKINAFSAVFVFYCGTFIHPNILVKIGNILHLPHAETRVFPLLRKVHNNNGVPLGLAFFLLAAYGILKLFDKKTIIHSLMVLVGAGGSFFFYAAFGPGLLVWIGCIGLIWVTKYKDADFRSFGIVLLIIGTLVSLSLLLVYPYYKQISGQGHFLEIRLSDLKNIAQNSFNFVLPSIISLCIVFFYRNFIKNNLRRQTLCLLGCLFISNILCYLSFDFRSNVEYKYLLLSLLPFGLIGGIAFMQIRITSKWLGLGLLFILLLPVFQITRYQIESSPQNIFEVDHTPLYYESGINLESSDPEENEMYRWIRNNTSMDTYFLDKKTKIPVYAQRSLWVAFDTGQKLPGYSIRVHGIKSLHGYDDQEYARRQQMTQNIFGNETSLTIEEIVNYLVNNKLLVVIRNNNTTLEHPNIHNVFVSDRGNYRILEPKD